MASNLKDLVKKNKKYIKEEINLNELVDKFLQERQQRPPKEFKPAFHPSLVSKGIDCQLWWFFYLNNYQGKPKKWKDENLTATMVGTGIHNEFQKTLYDMGILEGVYECVCCEHRFWATSPKDICPNCGHYFKSWSHLKFKEVPIHFGLVRGHADGIINQGGNRILLEIKSIKNIDRPNAQYGYEKLVNKPMEDHFIQAQIYLNAWDEIVRIAKLGEEFLVEDGKVSAKKIEGPVYDGAKVIGPINFAVIDYIAKNSSQKKSFLIKRNRNSVEFLLSEMQLIWKAYLEDTVEVLTGINENFKNKCKYCEYRNECSWLQ